MSGIIEPDVSSILELISPSDYTSQVDRQLGCIAVIGGSHGDPGAPYFAAISALKLGAAMSCVFCTKEAAPIIQTYSPELVVKPIMFESFSLGNEDIILVASIVIEGVVEQARLCDCLVIGPGLGCDQFLLYCVTEIMKQAMQAGIPMVIAGEGLYIVSNDISLIQNYRLAVLPLYISEFKQLALQVLGVYLNDDYAIEQLPSLSKMLGGVTILLKGKFDYITDGKHVYEMNMIDSPRHYYQDANAECGSIALFIAWARLRAFRGTVSISQTVYGCIAASAVFRHAGKCAFRNNKRSTLTSDIVENLGPSLEELCPLNKDEEEEEDEDEDEDEDEEEEE